jgi:hypothetical protein
VPGDLRRWQQAEELPANFRLRTLVPDADIEHMLRLLALIPGPEDVDFWNDIHAGRRNSGPEGALRDSGYATGKITFNLHRYLTTGEPKFAADLATYLLMIFDHEADSIPAAVDFAIGNLASGVLGRRWITDMTAAAWRVYARHSDRPTGSSLSWHDILVEKWPNDPDRYR